MTMQRLQIKAIGKLNTHSLPEVLRYIDEQLPLPDCPLKQEQVKWQREQVKSSVQASMRQTKTDGPSLTK